MLYIRTDYLWLLLHGILWLTLTLTATTASERQSLSTTTMTTVSDTSVANVFDVVVAGGNGNDGDGDVGGVGVSAGVGGNVAANARQQRRRTRQPQRRDSGNVAMSPNQPPRKQQQQQPQHQRKHRRHNRHNASQQHQRKRQQHRQVQQQQQEQKRHNSSPALLRQFSPVAASQIYEFTHIDPDTDDADDDNDNDDDGDGDDDNENRHRYNEDQDDDYDEEEQQRQKYSKEPVYYSDSMPDSMMEESTGSATDVKSPYDIFTCCNEVFGSCRTSCENFSLVQLATVDLNGRSFRLELKKYCPSMQLEFWSCMNRTLEAVARGTQWSGRRCCALGLSPRCRNACATSSSTDELINACRQSDEQHMFACFERQEAGDRCCGNARTSECLQACRDIFEPHTAHKRNDRQRLQQMCGEKNHDVLQCVRNVTDMSPVANSHKYLPCCEFSQVERCRQTCRSILNTTESTDIIIGELEAGGCGTPLPHLPLWQCFLTAERKIFVPATSSSQTEVSQINQIGIDAAKLHCCEKALSAKCRRMCVQTYTTDWTGSSILFDKDCTFQPKEFRLRQCLDEVEEPCELGCDGLSFCTNFNNRPTELFRSCNAQADMAARSDLRLWQQRGYVSLLGIDLPIKNMTRCAPEKWQAIVCTLQLKPCTHKGNYNHICREDCYDILSECMDWTRMSSTFNADAICARLHPVDENVTCVSLRPFLEESDAPKETGGHHGLMSACKGQPCNSSEVCVPAHNESNAFSCIPGCSLGEASNYLVPFGAYVRVPVLNKMGRSLAGSGQIIGSSSISGGVFKVCRCSVQGRIEFCQPLPSFSYENCILSSERNYRHSTSFSLECNQCSCYAGETTCTKRQCRFEGYTDPSYTSLPCNCPTHYVPVCGRNGNTYQSACLAKCLGLQDSEIEYGACTALSPCRENAHNCPVGTQCLEHRKICLSTMHRPCTQYQCVNQTRDCEATDQAVCDNKGRTHASACALLQSKAELAHWGACFRTCSFQGPVCGINGVTYVHECAAWADYILVDYRERCREVGLLADDMGRRCRTVKCAKMPSPHCRGVVPPGACCPICGGAFRVIYSRKQIDRALYALRGQNKDLLTLHSVLHELESLIQISECQLSGFLTMEVGLFVAVVPRTGKKPPTHIQIEACTREAQKLSSLINSQSHRITTNLVLSGLVISRMLDPSADSSSANWRANTANTLGLCLCLYVIIDRLLKRTHS